MMTSGFSAYGYRIGRLEALRGGKFEADSASRNGLTGRVGYKLTDTIEVELGGNLNSNKYQYDTGFGNFPDGPSTGSGLVLNGFGKISHSLFDGRFKHSLTAFGSSTERAFKSRSVSDFFGPPALSGTNYAYRGERQGAEYQGTLNWGAPGTTVFGARSEQERFIGKSQNVIPKLGFGRIDDKADQTTRSLFALHQISLTQRLHLSLGGRIDDVSRIDPFRTVRATLAYELPESDTKFRTSIGTGAKAPSLYQLYSAQYGTRTLEPETSMGLDAGIDQNLFDGRVKVSMTAFSNRYRNLIDYSSGKGCSPVQITNFTGCYINIAQARTAGLETSADIVIVPDYLRLKLAYTNLRAIDATTNLPLARRPENEGRIALAIMPIAGLTVEPVITFVGERWSSQGKTQKLQPYGKLDLLVDYKLNDNFTLYARGENLTDARYQEVKDYGTAGRSAYLGIRTTW
jgi:vitamin B12 transporter